MKDFYNGIKTKHIAQRMCIYCDRVILKSESLEDWVWVMISENWGHHFNVCYICSYKHKPSNEDKQLKALEVYKKDLEELLQNETTNND